MTTQIIQSCMCDGKVFLNSRQMQNADISCVILRQVGSWFHAHGAAMQNALSANIWFVYGATQSPQLAACNADCDEVEGRLAGVSQ